MNIPRTILLFLSLFLSPHSFSQSFTTPSTGSSLRKEVLDVIRKSAEAKFGQKVIFKVNILRISEQWAFFVGEAQQRDGSRINYKLSPDYKRNPTSMQGALEAGALYGGVDALLKKTDERWTITEIVFDAGDVHWLDYDKRFGVPKDMLTPK